MRICFHGAGGLGSLFGGYLAGAGHDVVLIGRPAHVEAIRRDGLRIEGIRGNHVVRERLEAVTDAGAVDGDLDVYVLTVKAKDTKAALHEASPLVGRTAAALSFQNTIVKDDALVAAFGDAGFASKSVDAIRQVEWEKLLQIATVASWSVCTLAGVPDAVIADGMANRWGAELYVTLATELLSIYRSLGFEPQDFYAPYSRCRELSGWTFEEAVDQIVAQGESMKAGGMTGRTSMHEDVLHGRRTEAPEILGPFIAQADTAGLDAPTLRTIHRIVMAVDDLLS